MEVTHPHDLACGHCGNIGLMKVLAAHNERDYETVKSPCGYLVKDIDRPWGVAYVLLMCMACEEVNLVRIDWHDGVQPEDNMYKLLYPGSGPVKK